MLVRFITIVVLLGLAFSALAFKPQDAGKAKIAVVPIRYTAPEKWEELKQGQLDRADKWFSEEFPPRGFELVMGNLVKYTLDELKIDFNDEANWTIANLYTIGEKLGVKYVLFAVITETGQRMREGLFPRREGWTTMKHWFVDVEKKQPILLAQSVKGTAGGGWMAPRFDKGSELQRFAVANSFRDAYKEFFKSCPKLKK